MCCQGARVLCDTELEYLHIVRMTVMQIFRTLLPLSPKSSLSYHVTSILSLRPLSLSVSPILHSSPSSISPPYPPSPLILPQLTPSYPYPFPIFLPSPLPPSLPLRISRSNSERRERDPEPRILSRQQEYSSDDSGSAETPSRFNAKKKVIYFTCVCTGGVRVVCGK